MPAPASMEDFEALLNESFELQTPEEGSVVKGTVLAVERTGHRRHRLQDGRPRRPQGIRTARTSVRGLNARRHRRGVSRARRERQAAKRLLSATRRGARRPGTARESLRERGPRRGCRSSAASRAASRSISAGPWPSCPAARSMSARCATHGPLMGLAAAVPDPQDGPPPRQHRRLAPRRARGEPRRAARRGGRAPDRRARPSTAW